MLDQPRSAHAGVRMQCVLAKGRSGTSQCHRQFCSHNAEERREITSKQMQAHFRADPIELLY